MPSSHLHTTLAKLVSIDLVPAKWFSPDLTRGSSFKHSFFCLSFSLVLLYLYSSETMGPPNVHPWLVLELEYLHGGPHQKCGFTSILTTCHDLLQMNVKNCFYKKKKKKCKEFLVSAKDRLITLSTYNILKDNIFYNFTEPYTITFTSHHTSMEQTHKQITQKNDQNIPR